MERRVRGRRAVVPALAPALLAVAGLTVSPVLTPSTAAAAGAGVRADTETDGTVVASANTQQVRFVVTAQPRSGAQNEPPEASVDVAAFERRGGEWASVGRQSLDETWFWEVVTGPQAVCRLSLSEHPEPRLTLSLRYSPSLGCAEPTRFAVVDGELVRE
ncbi:MAG TPA: hypothetical protein VIL34_14720 [Actinopolymorphaceae bacterium]